MKTNNTNNIVYKARLKAMMKYLNINMNNILEIKSRLGSLMHYYI